MYGWSSLDCCSHKRARAWAKYCWPHEDWTQESLLLLHNKNKVLCGRHFSSSQFYDNKRQKLSRFAVPDSDEVKELLKNRENIFDENEQLIEPSTSDVVSKKQMLSTRVLGPICKKVLPKVPFLEVGNVLAQPSTSGVVTIQKPVKVPPTFELSFNKVNELEITSAKTTSKTPSTVSSNLKSIYKKCHGILREINVSRTNQLTARELKLYNLCRKNVKEIIRLRKKLKSRKVDIIQSLYDDKNVEKLCGLNITNSFIILLQSQLKNSPKKPKGRRYTLNQKIMALVIYKKSPACYRLLRRMFSLACQSSLNKLLNRIPLRPGINSHIFSSLKKMASKQTEEDNICILSFDEMYIRKHLHYDPKLDEIQGFQDHGNHGRSQGIATKALMFMLAGLRKKWKQPIAFYFSSTITADRMTVILKEVLTQCFNADLNVVGTVCDMSTVNVKVLKTLGATTREPYFSHNGREVVAILDPPHLLKCTRNLFMKHDVQCTANVQGNNMTLRGTAKWRHLEMFYELDKINTTFVYAPHLSESHLRPNIKQQMKVNLAAQVFSSRVTAGLLAKIATNELTTVANATATFIKKIDELFDAMNADTPDARRGKIYSTNMTARSPHLKPFGEMRKFISEMTYVGARSKPPSQEGWIHSMNAIERLWKNLQMLKIYSLSTRRLNQDPLENCFGCIRYHCGSNNNPTMQQFVAGVKTAIISNLKHSGQRKNCEDDTGVLCDNLSSFLKSDMVPKQLEESNSEYLIDEIELILADAVEAVDQATPESQACAYVCGFIFKKMRNNDCQNCKKAFLTDVPETIHIFTGFKEYTEKQSLNYANKDMVQSVHAMATLIFSYLKTMAWKIQIKCNVMHRLEYLDFEFLKKCTCHLESNQKHLLNTTFYISIKRYILLKNREMDEEEKKKAVERKIRILRNK